MMPAYLIHKRDSTDTVFHSEAKSLIAEGKQVGENEIGAERLTNRRPFSPYCPPCFLPGSNEQLSIQLGGPTSSPAPEQET